MTARHGLFVANGSSGVTSPIEARVALAGLLSSVPGILRGCNVTGSSSGPNMKYTVASGQLATQRGANITTDGLYLWGNDGNLTVDSGSPAPSSGTRYDLVWALASNANDGFGDANSDTALGVTVGTARSSPSKPYGSVPAGALVLAEALVGTNIANAAAATITQVAPQIAARGGIRPVTDSSQYPASPRLGEYIDDATLGLLRWNGTAWVGGDIGWQTLTLTGAFSGNAEYRSIGSQIFVEGSINRSVASAPGTSFTGAFATLPAGCRPRRFLIFRVPTADIGTDAQIQVNTDGTLQLRNMGTATIGAGSNMAFSFDFAAA